MKWATRKNIKCDRITSAWLIKRFIDSDAEIHYVDEDDITGLTSSGVLTFDAATAKFKHIEDPINGKYGEKCTFQILLEEYRLSECFPALEIMGNIVYAADIAHKLSIFEPHEGYGLWAITQGFSLMDIDDNEKERIEFPICDALYRYCQYILEK